MTTTRSVPDLELVEQIGHQIGRLDSIADYLTRMADGYEGRDRYILLVTANDLRITGTAIADIIAPPAGSYLDKVA